MERPDGQRLQVRTPQGKVTGYWDGQTLRTWRHGAWAEYPAETQDQARDQLRQAHAG